MPHLLGNLRPDGNYALGYDWDPRWCKDPEQLQTKCPKGHLKNQVGTDAKVFCPICTPRHGRVR